MKALQLKAVGIQGLNTEEVPEPALAAGEVLIKVKAGSINFRDLAIVEGSYPWHPPLPYLVGSDIAGEVVKIGAGVTEFRAGDRVASVFHPDWEHGEPTPKGVNTNLAGTYPGAFSELVALPERALVKTPAAMSFAEAATLPIAALTAWTALVESGGIKSGDHVLIEGTGGVSIFALQFAKMAGAVPIVLSSSDEKLDKARKLGAAHTINYRKTPNWSPEVLKLTGGRGVEHVVEVAGHATFAQALESLAIHGHLVVIGFLGGALSEIDLRRLMQKSARIEGVSVGSRQGMIHMIRAMEVAGTKPVIDRTFKFKDAQKAFEHMKAANHFGKIVIEF